jgi:hypothetical protein
MSDANLVVPRRPATDIDDVALGMIHLVVDAEFASLRDALDLALKANHRLTLLLEEREETIAALLAKPRLRVVREDDWIDVKHDSEAR